MAGEVELKLSLAPGAAREVARLPWLRDLSGGRMERETLRSVYFDTRKLELRDRGLVLRVREADRRRVQTIKSTAGARGPFERGEWEHEISGNAPDLGLARGTPLSPLARKKRLRRELEPVFETVVERTRFPIRTAGAQVQLALDRGHILTRRTRRRERISEIELELKDGDPAQLSGIAERLARSAAVGYAPRSKAERGYALHARSASAPIRGRKIVLSARATAGDAFRIIGLSCLDHAVANERAIRRNDPEGVHQMRVGLRRLRAAISLFKKMLPGPQAAAVKRELKWLTEQLGAARDLDVLITKEVSPLRGAARIGAEALVLERDLDIQRDAGMDKARAALDSDRYRAIGIHTALWLAYGSWSRSSAAAVVRCRQMPADEFAAAALARRTRKILKKARKAASLDPRARHKLRIAVKKLRYACEFFASLFAGNRREARRKRFCKTLKHLQDFLGTLNDLEVHKRLATAMARDGARSAARPREALAMGFITGREEARAGSCFAGLGKATRQLGELPPFWN